MADNPCAGLISGPEKGAIVHCAAMAPANLNSDASIDILDLLLAIGMWGTEKVWPRSARLPKFDVIHPPLVQVRVGPPVELGYEDLEEDTERIMAAIVEQLPDEARVAHEPTDEELALTYPAGYKGDPSQEVDRRPGSDT